MKTKRLIDILNLLLNEKIYDFKKPLQVAYRCIGPELHDMLIGYCVVGRKMSGFTFLDLENDEYTCDDDTYGMGDEVFMWRLGDDGMLRVWVQMEEIENE